MAYFCDTFKICYLLSPSVTPGNELTNDYNSNTHCCSTGAICCHEWLKNDKVNKIYFYEVWMNGCTTAITWWDELETRSLQIPGRFLGCIVSRERRLAHELIWNTSGAFLKTKHAWYLCLLLFIQPTPHQMESLPGSYLNTTRMTLLFPQCIAPICYPCRTCSLARCQSLVVSMAAGAGWPSPNSPTICVFDVSVWNDTCVHMWACVEG